MKAIFFFINFFAVFLLKAQPAGFFVNIPYDDINAYPINYHVKLVDCIIYTKDTVSISNGSSNYSSSHLVKQNYQGQVISQTILGVDSLKSFCSYGNNLDNKIQTFCFATKDNKLYLIYQLFDFKLEEQLKNVFYLDTINEINIDQVYNIIRTSVEIKTISNSEDKYFVAMTWPWINKNTSYGLVFDLHGSLIKSIRLTQSLGVSQINSGLIFNYNTNQINYISNSRKHIFDDEFTFLKTINTVNWPPSVNDTSTSIFTSIIEHDKKWIRFGKTAIAYNWTNPDEEYGVYGRGISEIDNNLKIKGKLNLTPMPMTAESDGVARLGSSLFYRNGYYYSIFEYQDQGLPVPSPNTIYITRYDTTFNIVEETQYMITDEFRFFFLWVDLSESLQFSVSGFYLSTDDGNKKNGNYILAFNLDGSMPTLSNKTSPILATITIKGNPTSDYLTLSSPDADADLYDVRLYDLNGRLVRSVNNWNEGTVRIPVYDQPTGTYVFQVWHKGRPLTSGKFLKI